MLLYQQIHEYILNLIKEDPKLTKLPSERQLQDVFHSTRITVREALIRLEAEGIIYRLNRKGWFVNSERLNWDPVKKVNFYALAQEQGFSPKTQLIDIKTLDGTKPIRDEFAVSAKDKLQQITRLRLLDGRPVLSEVIYCRENDFPQLTSHTLEGSLTEIFARQYGVDVTHERSQIFVSALPKEEALALEQNEGSPCLKIIRKRYNKQDKLVDYNIEFWVHGAIELQVNSLVQ